MDPTKSNSSKVVGFLQTEALFGFGVRGGLGRRFLKQIEGVKARAEAPTPLFEEFSEPCETR